MKKTDSLAEDQSSERTCQIELHADPRNLLGKQNYFFSFLNVIILGDKLEILF